MKRILASLFAGVALFGADLYVGEDTPLLDKIGGKQVAQLSVGAKLKQISAKGEWVQVEYAGYAPQDSTIAYGRLGVLEKDAEVQNEKSFKVIKKVKDDYDNEWTNVALKGFIKKSALRTDINQIYAAGEELYQTRCGGCHALHGHDEFGANVWPSVVDSMAAQAALEPNEKAVLVRFLQSKAPTE